MQTRLAPRHVAQRAELAGGEDRLDVGVAAGLAHGAHLVVERPPVLGEHVGAGDDDVDLLRARRHRRADLGDALLERREARREIRSTPRRPECPSRRAPRRAVSTNGVVDADRGDPDGELARAERLEEVVAHRPARLGAQPAHPARRVVARQRGEVHAGDGAQQPGRLPFLLDRAPGAERRGAALDGAAVDPDLLDPVELERHARGSGVPPERRAVRATTARRCRAEAMSAMVRNIHLRRLGPAESLPGPAVLSVPSRGAEPPARHP